jgi:hypothetical protein
MVWLGAALAGCVAAADRAPTGSISRDPAANSLPSLFSRAAQVTGARLPDAEAEAVVAQAIAQHEMRRP